MASRYEGPSTKSKYKITDHVYGTYDKSVVDAGLESGEFVLMERTVHAKEGGKFVGRPDRRFIPKDSIQRLSERGWHVVEMYGSERSATIAPKKAAGSKGPAA